MKTIINTEDIAGGSGIGDFLRDNHEDLCMSLASGLMASAPIVYMAPVALGWAVGAGVFAGFCLD